MLYTISGANSYNSSLEMAPNLSAEEILYEKEHIHDNRGPTIIATSVVFTALSIAATALRLFARRLNRTAYGLDDYFISLAAVLISETLQAVMLTS